MYTYKLISETGYGLNQFGKRLDELRISGTGEILGKKIVFGIKKQEKILKKKHTQQELQNLKRSNY